MDLDKDRQLTQTKPRTCRGLFCREGEQLKRFLESLTRLELRKFRSLDLDGFAGLGIGVADNRQIRNVTENGPNDRTATLSQLLGGDKPYIRQDGKGFFDSVDDVSRAEGGVYYERRMNCHRFSTKSAITELRAFLMPLLWLTSEVAKALKLTDGDCTSL